jgi:hypothetical protein
MLRQSIRSSQSFALGFALCIVAAGATGCSESSTTGEESPVTPDVTHKGVSATDTENLTADTFLKIDLASEKVVYDFKYGDKAIAYDRIQLVAPGGATTLLSDEMKAVQEGNYGDYPQPNLLGASNKQFSIATNAADFGVLTPSQLDELKISGFFYEEAALKAPKAAPQSTDNCIHAVCEFCFENGTSSPPVSWQPGTYHCYYEEHVWCD